jgi:hypothetical protein
MIAGNNIVQLVQVLLMLSIFQKIDEFELFNRKDVESSIVALFYKRNSYEANEGEKVKGGW